MSWRTLATLLAAVAAGCSVPNQSHCGNQSGDASCAARDPERPYCNLCEASNDGCVAERVTVEACHRESDSGPGATSTGEPPTSTSTTTTDAPPTTGTTTTGTTEPGTSTSTGTGATTGTSTTDDTTTGTTGTTGTTATDTGTTDTTGETDASSSSTDSSTTMVGPVCGDGMVEGQEACDLDDLDGKKCTDFANYGGGVLECAGNCTFDVSGCCKVMGVQCAGAGECCSGKCNLGLPSKCG